MATQEQIEQISTLLEGAHPVDLFQKMHTSEAGIGAGLRFLYESDRAVTAGDISRFMHVSTARVAVLLRKMELKGYILRAPGPTDARTTLITLSPLGRQTAEDMRADFHRRLSTVIDQVGIEKMMEFISIAKEICARAGAH